MRLAKWGYLWRNTKAHAPALAGTRSGKRPAYAVGRRAMIFLAAAAGGIRVAILRIIAKTRRLSPSESVLLYFLISARKRISS